MEFLEPLLRITMPPPPSPHFFSCPPPKDGHFFWAVINLQGGKTFSASFCASLIVGSRRAFLCVDCRLCLFVARVLSELHEVRTFAPSKAFLFDMFAFFFSSLENYFGFRTTNVKGKTDHSVWNKKF